MSDHSSSTHSSAASDIPVTGRKVLPPDPRIVQAIGRNHNFDSAIADIVDNSLDAGASKILIRFVREGDELIGLYIADNGRGMDEDTIDRAMTLGGQRTYSNNDLGHFGVGLKAASLSQARSLTVVSRASTSPAVGRRLLAERLSEGFECELIAGDFAASIMDRPWGHLTTATGTVVIWNNVKAFPKLARSGAIDAFLDDATYRLCHHLGLIFHRIIEAEGVEIVIDQEDIKLDETGAPFVVKPINPFGYSRSGRAGYPRVLTAESGGAAITLRCHIWPGRSNDGRFKLAGGTAEPFQGFFIYRNARLLQAGGWHRVTLLKPELQLARIEIEIADASSKLFEMNPEKTQVEPTNLFVTLVHAATDGEATFDNFLEDASNTYRESRKRNRDRPRVIPPGAGFAPAVKSAISDEFDFVPGRDPLEIRWTQIDGDSFFEVDKAANIVKLNRRYRAMLAGEGRASLNDAPLLKALIYLLAESVYRGEVLGPRDKDNISIWQEILTAAVLAEQKREQERTKDLEDTSTTKDSNTTSLPEPPQPSE